MRLDNPLWLIVPRQRPNWHLFNLCHLLVSTAGCSPVCVAACSFVSDVSWKSNFSTMQFCGYCNMLASCAKWAASAPLTNIPLKTYSSWTCAHLKVLGQRSFEIFNDIGFEDFKKQGISRPIFRMRWTAAYVSTCWYTTRKYVNSTNSFVLWCRDLDFTGKSNIIAATAHFPLKYGNNHIMASLWIQL